MKVEADFPGTSSGLIKTWFHWRLLTNDLSCGVGNSCVELPFVQETLTSTIISSGLSSDLLSLHTSVILYLSVVQNIRWNIFSCPSNIFRPWYWLGCFLVHVGVSHPHTGEGHLVRPQPQPLLLCLGGEGLQLEGELHEVPHMAETGHRVGGQRARHNLQLKIIWGLKNIWQTRRNISCGGNISKHEFAVHTVSIFLQPRDT